MKSEISDPFQQALWSWKPRDAGLDARSCWRTVGFTAGMGTSGQGDDMEGSETSLIHSRGAKPLHIVHLAATTAGHLHRRMTELLYDV